VSENDPGAERKFLHQIIAVSRRTSRPSPLQYKEERDDNKENFVAAVGSQDSYNSRKQQNKNNAHNNGKDNFHDLEPPSFDQRQKFLNRSGANSV
jgi:hypothetical protein